MAHPIPAPVPHVFQNISATDNSSQHVGHVYYNYAAPRLSRRDRLLQSLYFDGMHHRELEPFEGMYEWIFDDDATSFTNWARSTTDHGIFWITGKAGSGKSTLMSFLADHEQTQELLGSWAGDSTQVVTANFFFWNAGNKMQKSQLGLTQGLLYQLVERCENVGLETIAPRRRTDNESSWRWPWTRRELSEALTSLLRKLPTDTPLRFCLFVDGLDEYELDNADEGNHEDLIRYLEALNASRFVKLCVSSRLWNVFQTAYAGCLQIKMQDLTRADMSYYIQSQLPQVHLLDHSSLLEISETIQQAAEGVFLWVKLAMKDVRRGIADQDDLPTLLRRIEQVPKSLDAFLDRIFSSIEPVHEIYAARTLLFTLHAETRTGYELPEYSCIEELVAEPGLASTSPICPFSRQELIDRTARAHASVNKWCKDLLEVTRTDDQIDQDGRSPHLAIEFPHRTIFEFVLQKSRFGVLARMAGSNFDPAVEKWKLQLLVLKGTPDTETDWYYIQHNLLYLQRTFEERGRDYTELFEEHEEICTALLGLCSDIHWSCVLGFGEDNITPVDDSGYSALSAASTNMLWQYVAYAVAHRLRTYSTQQMHYVLALLVSWPREFDLIDKVLDARNSWQLNAKLVKWKDSGHSVWELALQTFVSNVDRSPAWFGEVAFQSQVKLMERMLLLGAHPNALLRLSDLDIPMQDKILNMHGGQEGFLMATETLRIMHQYYVEIQEPGEEQRTEQFGRMKDLLESAALRDKEQQRTQARPDVGERK